MRDSNDDFSQRSWLELALVEHVPLEAKLACLAHWGSPGEVLRQSPERLKNCHQDAAAIATGADPDRVGQAVKWATATGGNLLFMGDEDYPQQLTDRLHDPPLVLFTRGSFSTFKHPTVALVGTPKPSEAGSSRARTIALELAQEKITIAAGISPGVSQAALSGALSVPAPAIGVIGNARSWEGIRIAEETAKIGLLISEIAPGNTSPNIGYARRYRLLAAMASLLILVEAPANCDSLKLAALAGDLGCEVAAVPCSPEQNACRGGNFLIRDGAALVENANDVMRLLSGSTER